MIGPRILSAGNPLHGAPYNGNREIRLLEHALKATNAKTVIDTYSQDDAVLGELS